MTTHEEGPLHIYRGGNFTKIAGNGYDEIVEKTRHLGGAVASMDDYKDNIEGVRRHDDASIAVANAERLVACWNAFVGTPTEEIKNLKMESTIFGYVALKRYKL